MPTPYSSQWTTANPTVSPTSWPTANPTLGATGISRKLDNVKVAGPDFEVISKVDDIDLNRESTLFHGAKRDCEEASKGADVISVSVDSCAVTPSHNLISLVDQSGDHVTFTVSQTLIRCQNSQDLSWIATDFVNKDDELVCFKENNVKCGYVNTYTAHCEDGVSVIDLFLHDRVSGILKQTDGSKVVVPDACNTKGSDNAVCHFRYIVQCTPSMCKGQETKAHIRYVG